MPSLSFVKTTPKETTANMVKSWWRNHKVSDQYYEIAQDVINRVSYLGVDDRNQYAIDYALVRALMRLDREGVYIYPSVRNIQMGASRLIDFVRTYDADHAGELSIIKEPEKLKCRPETIEMIVTDIVVYVSCLYALKMNKLGEVIRYSRLLEEKNQSHKSRVWIQDELQDFLAKNIKFSEGKYLDEICIYITKPTQRAASEKKTRLW